MGQDRRGGRLTIDLDDQLAGCSSHPRGQKENAMANSRRTAAGSADGAASDKQQQTLADPQPRAQVAGLAKRPTRSKKPSRAAMRPFRRADLANVL